MVRQVSQYPKYGLSPTPDYPHYPYPFQPYIGGEAANYLRHPAHYISLYSDHALMALPFYAALFISFLARLIIRCLAASISDSVNFFSPSLPLE